MSDEIEGTSPDRSAESSVDYDGLLADAKDESGRIQDSAKAEAMARAEAPYQRDMEILKKMNKVDYMEYTQQDIDGASTKAAERYDAAQAAAAHPDEHLELNPAKAEAMARAADPYEEKAKKHEKKQINAQDWADGFGSYGMNGANFTAMGLEAKADHHKAAAERARAHAEDAAQKAAKKFKDK